MNSEFSKIIDKEKENIFETKKNIRRNINFNGNIILLIHANDDKINSKISFPRLSHKISGGLVFFYCRNGKVAVELSNNEKIVINKNSIFISRSDLIKNMTKLEPTNLILMYFKKEFFNLYFDSDFNIQEGRYNLTVLKNYESTAFERALNYHIYPKKLQKVFIISRILDGLLSVSNYFLKINAVKNKMEYINNYIVSNLGEKLTIKTLSNKISISETSFKLRFKEYFGLSSKEYITNLRLETAKDLLLNTNLNIKEIILKVGIENYQTFYNLFISCYGLSPSKMRVKRNETINRA